MVVRGFASKYSVVKLNHTGTFSHSLTILFNIRAVLVVNTFSLSFTLRETAPPPSLSLSLSR